MAKVQLPSVRADACAGKVILKLHPRALEYLASRLKGLEELDKLRRSAPVEFLRGAFTDLEDYNRLQRVQQILSRVKKLCVLPTVCHLRCAFFTLLPSKFLSAHTL